MQGFVFTGIAFTDGAVRMGATTDLWRACWDVVTVDEWGNVMGGCDGTCSDEFPTSLRAELVAVIACLRRAATPIIIYDDKK